MSSEIIFKRLFVKVNDQIIPMVQTGSSNCTQMSDKGREVTARSWYNSTFMTCNKLTATREEIVTKIDEWRDTMIERYKDREVGDQYNDKSFGYFTGIRFYGGRKVTFNAFRSFYDNGCKTAVTLEELGKSGIGLSLSRYVYNDEQKKQMEEKLGKPLLPNVYLTSTEQAERVIKEWVEYYGEHVGSFTFDRSDWTLDDFILFKNKKQRKPKQVVEVDRFWYINFIGRGYFAKKTARSIMYAYYMCGSVRKFLTQKQAEKYRTKMLDDRFEVKEYDCKGSVTKLEVSGK